MHRRIQQAVILAGGFGTRLQNNGISTPKILLKVKGKTLLENHIRELEENGFTKLIISLGVKSNDVLSFLETLTTSIDIQIIIDRDLQGTKNAIIQTENHLEPRFLLLMGDLYHRNFLSGFLNFSNTKNNRVSDAIFSARWTDHPMDSDLIFTDDQDSIIEFQSKNDPNREIAQNLALSGASVMNKRMLYSLKFCGEISDYTEAIFLNNQNPKNLKAYISSEIVFDVGTPERLEEINNISEKRIAKPAVFFDRDGTLIEYVHLITTIDEVKLSDGAQLVCNYFQSIGFQLVCISNMPQVARNLLTFKQAHVLTNKILKLFENSKTYFQAFYICPHHPDKGFDGENKKYKVDCKCRKPEEGLVLRAHKQLNIDLKNSIIIGDSWRDVLLGKKLGLKTIFISNGLLPQPDPLPDFSYVSMEELQRDLPNHVLES
jgi:histidinol-phosphate phosphatase family protein